MVEHFHPRLSLACSFQKEEAVLLDMLLAIEPDARVFALDTHVLFPETYDVWRQVEKRYGIQVEVYEGPSLGRQAAIHGDALWASNPSLCCAIRKVGPARQCPRRPRRLDHRHAARAVAHPRERAEARAGTSATSSGRRTRSRTGRTPPSTRTSRSASCPSTRSTRRATPRSAARTAPSRAAAARGAGAAPARPSAGCTSTMAAESPALPPRRARGGGRPHHARGRGRARAAGAALLGRQGLDRAAPPRREGVPPGPLPLPADARRHGPQLPRGDRVPRPAGRRARRAARRRLGAGVDRQGPRRRADRARAPPATSCRRRRCSTRWSRNQFDAAIGGARRDEERSRAKERIFSFRDDFGQWDPRAQRPELWNLYNGKIRKGEQVRVFPISNWTELDVWQYVAREELELPSIYYAHEREVFERDGMLYATSDVIARDDDEAPFTEWVRFRTVGDMSCTGAVRSQATSFDESSPRSPRRASRSAARPAPTTAPPRPRWRTGSVSGTSDLRPPASGRPRPPTFSASSPADRSTTASRR